MNEESKQREYSLSDNIWGWKFSYLGLIVILAFAAIIAYRSCQLGVHPLAPPTEVAADSTSSQK